MEFESSSRALVLIVGDVEMSREIIKRCMHFLGFTCDEACDGAEAAVMCAAKKYSLVLMGSVMPRMNGMEATAAIRHGDLLIKTSRRFIGLTGDALFEDVYEF
jgi:CheY-like chemotaxis protein